jgi:hypothetical protein
MLIKMEKKCGGLSETREELQLHLHVERDAEMLPLLLPTDHPPVNLLSQTQWKPTDGRARETQPSCKIEPNWGGGWKMGFSKDKGSV